MPEAERSTVSADPQSALMRPSASAPLSQAAIPGAADHPFYGEWIRSYAGEDYQKTNDALVELMDTLAESCTEAEYQRLEEIFINCSRYELGFWEMAWTLER